MAVVNDSLLQLFRAHRIDAVADGDWIIFPGRPVRARAEIVGEQQLAAATTAVQLDVRLEIAPGRTIVESFVGYGGSRERAVADVLEHFSANTFHVFLAAFFRPDETQVSQEEWQVGGRKSQVTLGDATIRGKPPVAHQDLLGWFPTFEAMLREQPLRPGTHWVRLFYSQMAGKPLACEALLDNEPWEAMQAQLHALTWPAGDDYYSMRLFLVAKVEKGGDIGPETAVAWLADAIAGRDDLTEDDAYAAMAEAGIPDKLANRAYNFTQEAWGRAFLEGVGVKFSPDYFCMDAAGEVVESGQLAQEACFRTASRLAQRYAGAPGLLRMAMMSSVVNVVNKALNDGSKPEDLACAPFCTFLEAPTEKGMENARRKMTEMVEAIPLHAGTASKSKPKKPWWKFW